jgi:hypothetical protein
MTTRTLPREEWHRLAGTEAEPLLPGLPPETTVIAVEQDGQLLGCWLLLRMVHAECIWIAPEHRKRGRVAARLLSAMYGIARAWKVRNVWTGAATPEVAGLVRKLGGVPIPGEHFALPVGE